MFFTIRSRRGNHIRIHFEYDCVDLIFGVSGEQFHYQKYPEEKDLLAAVLKCVRALIREELVSVSYFEFDWKQMRQQRRMAMVPPSELDKYRGRKKFASVSWNDRYSENKPPPEKD